MSVVETTVARHLAPDKRRLLVRFVGRRQLYLCHHQPFVVAIKLVDLEGMTAGADQIAGLVDDARLA